jgi:hypothetical protein
LRHHYDKNTQPHTLQVRDLVLRRIQKTDGRHKLLGPWEGPLIIANVTGLGSCELMTEDGTLVSYEDSMPKESRHIFSPRYYVNRVHNQYNKDDYLSYKTKLPRVVPTPNESK